MTEPTTEAGRALLDEIQDSIAAGGGLHVTVDDVLAIEVEARAKALRDVREAVNAYGFAAKPLVMATLDRISAASETDR